MAPFRPAPGRFPSCSTPAARSATLLLLLLSVTPARAALAQVPQPRDTTVRRIPLGALNARAPSFLATPPTHTPTTPARITVPNVTGLMLPEAVDRLAAVGLKVGAVDSMQSGAPAGSVVSQWPAAGSTLPAQALARYAARYAARLSLATGSPGSAAPQGATVPNLAGLTLDEARGLLEQARLRPGTVTEVAGEAAKGTVAGQSPPGGTPADPGSGVDIQISTGPAQVTVPQLVGKTLAEAEAALAGVPLHIVRVDSVAASPGNGTIVRQTPLAGSLVPPGAGISLVRGVATSPVPATVPARPRVRPRPRSRRPGRGPDCPGR